MAKRGRPRKQGVVREANGRPQRPSLAQIEAADKRARLVETAQAAGQPHRVGWPNPRDPKLASALGRFSIRHKLRDELYDAGIAYADLTRRWRAAWGVPDPTHSDSLGGGLGPSEATVARWWKDIEAIENALRRKSPTHYLAARHLCIDDGDLPDDARAVAIEALMVLAEETGRDVQDHPFVGRVVDKRMAA